VSRSDKERFGDILAAIGRCENYEPYLRYPLRGVRVDGVRRRSGTHHEHGYPCPLVLRQLVNEVVGLMSVASASDAV
jgi:hypothetical protein